MLITGTLFEQTETELLFSTVVLESNSSSIKRCFHRNVLMNHSIIAQGSFVIIMIIFFPIGKRSF